MKNFYDGQIFVVTREVAATAPGKCTCGSTWDIGDKIAWCEWDPWGEKDFARMHVDCARSHPRNRNNIIEKEFERSAFIYSTQRACIEFIQNHPEERVEVIFYPKASKFLRYAYRVVK